MSRRCVWRSPAVTADLRSIVPCEQHARMKREEQHPGSSGLADHACLDCVHTSSARQVTASVISTWLRRQCCMVDSICHALPAAVVVPPRLSERNLPQQMVSCSKPWCAMMLVVSCQPCLLPTGLQWPPHNSLASVPVIICSIFFSPMP